MKKLLCCALAAAVSLAVAAPCFAAGSPWDGTWKLNQAKSKMTGSTFTISMDGGMYTVDTGTIKFQYACDGKDYTIIADRTISCTGGGNSFTVGIKVAGKPYSTTHRTHLRRRHDPDRRGEGNPARRHRLYRHGDGHARGQRHGTGRHMAVDQGEEQREFVVHPEGEWRRSAL